MNAGSDARAHGASLERLEVYQATGILIAAFGLDAAGALARLRTHAIACDLTPSEVAHRLLDGRIVPVEGDLRPARGDLS